MALTFAPLAAAVCAATLLWTAVVHGLFARRWLSPALGAAVASAIAALSGWETLPFTWPAAAGGAAAGAAIAAGSLELARRRTLRGRRGATTSAVARLWRGELPLHLGLLSVLVWLLTMAWTGAATGVISIPTFPRTVGLLVVLNWALTLAGVALWLVGAWRSTRADAPRPVGRPLAWLVRALLAFAWLLWLSVAALSAVPDAREYGPLAFGASERAQFSFRVLRGGRELELRGTLGFGVTDDLRAELDRNPEVRIVHLTSDGGRIAEGLRLAALFRARKLTTYVSAHCESACALAYSGGEPRLLASGGRIGLHAPSRAHVGGLADRRSSRVAVDALVEAGVDRKFAERGIATPPDRMWHPGFAELVAARLVTRRAGANEVALSGISPDELDRLALSLRESRFFQALFEFERPTFDRYVAALRDGHARGASLEEAIAPVKGELDALIERVVDEDLPRASDRAVRGFFEAFLALFRDRAAAGNGCAVLLAGLEPEDLPLAVKSPVLDAYAEVLSSARLDPPPAARPTDAHEEDLADVVTVLEERQPGAAEALDDVDAPTEERRARACVALIALYEEILALPEARSATLLRAIAAEVAD